MKTTTTYGVEGMTCAHCVASVIDEVGQVPDVEGVTAELVKGGISRVTVTSPVALDRALVAAAVEEAGYQLVAVV